MAPETVRVRGLSKFNRDLGKIAKALPKELGDELVDLGNRAVVPTARRKAARFGAKTVAGYAAKRKRGGAVVQQRARKVTGKRGDFGELQQREVLEPALRENEREVIEGVEDVLDRLTSRHGFGRGGKL